MDKLILTAIAIVLCIISLLVIIPITTILLLLLTFLFIYKYQTKYYRFFADQNVKCITPSFPCGNFSPNEDLMGNELKHYKEIGKVYGRYDGRMPVLTVGERDLVERIMFTDFNKFPNRRDMRMGDPTFDNTLFALEGDDWKRIRNIVSQGFTHSNVKIMIPLLEECCDQMVLKLTQKSENGEPIYCQEHLSVFVLNTIARCAFGLKIEDNDPFVEHSKILFKEPLKTIFVIVAPKLMTLLKMPMLNTEATAFFNQVMALVVDQRRKMTEKRYGDFLQRMLEQEIQGTNNNNSDDEPKPKDEQDVIGGLTQREMLSQCISFFMAGFEATTSLLSHCIYRLAVDPNCQSRAVEEIEQTMPNADTKYENESEKIDAMACCLSKLRYIEAIIKECSRICPPMARLERRAAEDYYFPEGDIHLKKDFLVSIPVLAMHNDPDYFPDPESFNPDRFYECKERNAFKSILFTFGAGARQCVAINFVNMQVKMCLVSLLTNFKILPAPNTPEQLKILESRNVLRVDDVNIILQSRT